VSNILRREATVLILSGLMPSLPVFGLRHALAAEYRGMVFKSPTCGCCADWVNHLEKSGIRLDVKNLKSLQKIKKTLQVPRQLQSCHTGIIGNYVIEGHVPVRDIRRLLTQKPKAIGLAVPGMPIGSPGMEQGDRNDPYEVVLFHKGGQRIFARY